MLRHSAILVRSLARGAVLGMLLLPAFVYTFSEISRTRQMAVDDARIQASRANSVIAAHPDGWHYVSERFLDQIAEVRHTATQTVLTTLDGKRVTQIGEDCSTFCIVRRAPLMDFGRVAGSLEVSVSLSDIITKAFCILLFGFVFALFLIRLLNRHVLDPLATMRGINEELAFYDPLTRLPNRRLLMDRLCQAVITSNRSKEYGGLVILDLDHFKVINDSEGHEFGDRLLVEVAQRIQAYIRQEDTIARVGGDEFAIVVENLGHDETSAAQQAELIAGKIQRAVNQPYTLAGGETTYHNTVSLGVTLFCGLDLTNDTLFKQADLALYQGKEAGRNSIRFFNTEMQHVIDKRAAMERALHRGLDQAEFRLFYQPQFNRSERLIGAEALIRWFPPGLPAVPPAHFIPLAEESGLIVPLGLWVIRAACEQLKRWEGSALSSLKVAVNVSARQFRQPDFVDQVSGILLQTGADPRRLKIELTESVVADGIDSVIEKMESIRTFGVSFALDDFGTGFSSLQYLKRLPLNEVKIDQSFVRDITNDPEDAAIVRAILAMSQSLGLEVVAEGVETREQLDYLSANGCTSYQGYYFSRPVPIEEFNIGAEDPGGSSFAI